jgi:hypothetical protein
MLRFRRTLVALLPVNVVAMAVLIALPASAHAVVERELRPNDTPTNQLRISPPRIELDVVPGKRAVVPISITNDSPNPQDISLTPKDFAASSDPKQIGNAVEDGEFGAGDWITPELRDVRLKPFERISMNVVIEPPIDAPTGTNLGALLVRGVLASGPIGALDQKSSVVIDALLEVFLTVAGPVEHTLSITSVDTRDSYRFGSNRLIAWDVTFRNDGTVNEHVEGSLDVQSIFGNRAARVKIPPLLVLRGASRTLRLFWRDVPWVGAFTPKVVVRGDDARTQERTGSRTIVLPWWVFPLIAVLVLGPAIWLWLARRRDWKRYLELEDQDADPDDDEFADPWDPAAGTRV